MKKQDSFPLKNKLLKNQHYSKGKCSAPKNINKNCKVRLCNFQPGSKISSMRVVGALQRILATVSLLIIITHLLKDLENLLQQDILPHFHLELILIEKA